MHQNRCRGAISDVRRAARSWVRPLQQNCTKPLCYHREMGRLRTVTLVLIAAATATIAAAADKRDPLTEARLLYNDRMFEAAVNAAEQARLVPSRADSADLIAARAYLE